MNLFCFDFSNLRFEFRETVTSLIKLFANFHNTSYFINNFMMLLIEYFKSRDEIFISQCTLKASLYRASFRF